MNDALYIAATGMHGQQMSLETIANNIANINTPTFKAAQVNFSDLMHRFTAPAGAPAAGIGLGSGVESKVVFRDFAPAALKPTSGALDLAVQGRGFIEVAMADGSRAYTRGGTLTVNKDGLLATASGHALKPEIQVPSNMIALHVAADGQVAADVAGTSMPMDIGRLDLVDFVNAAGLKPIGEGLYASSEESGEAISGRIGEDGLGSLVQGALEASNVELSREMVTLMMAQRAYELSSRVVQVADTVMELTNNLVRR
jgi:flagellar basal-body rod protein FlgG